MQYREIMRILKTHSNPDAVAGMAKYGITSKKVYGASIPALRKLAREIGKDHALALRLWSSGVLDARLLACFIDDAAEVTEEQMESWVSEFDNWAICDQCCSDLFDKTTFAYRKAIEWSKCDEEFVKRAAFALMAALAVHDKKAGDRRFERFLPTIKRQATDDRNYVKKAVNWALRQIGKRNLALNTKAIKTAEQIRCLDSPAARWIASDALRELRSEGVQRRLRRRVD